MPTEEELVSYYNSSYTVSQSRYAMRVDDEFPLLRELVNRAGLLQPGRMLEIGCSYGDMLSRFTDLGWKAEGVEVDSRATAHARAVFGLTVHQGSLDDVRSSLRGPYDLITMFHVIEHVRCVRRLADTLSTLVASGGLLVIKTPNGASLMSRILRGWWEWSAVPEHVHLFTNTSLRTLLARSGFTPELSLTRRGDAHSTIHELIRGAARRLSTARPRGERLFAAVERGTTITAPPISTNAVYRAGARILDAASRPVDLLLEAVSGATNSALQPELLLLARRSSTTA